MVTVGIDDNEDVDVLEALGLGFPPVATGEEVVLQIPVCANMVADFVVLAAGEVALGLGDLEVLAQLLEASST